MAGDTTIKLPRKKRARAACVSCHQRKVRCDATRNTGSCTNCTLDGKYCLIVPGRKDTKHRRGTSSKWTSGIPATGNSSQKWQTVLPQRPPHISNAEFKLLKDETVFTMPDRQSRLHLSQCFMHNVYPDLPVMTLYDLGWMVDVDRNFTFSSWFVMAAVYAVSVNFAEICVLKEMGFTCREDASQFFMGRAQMLYGNGLDDQNYAAIKGLLIMGLCAREFHGKDGWDWLGMAARIAMAIKLDIEPAIILTPCEKRLRRRLWWSLYTQFCLVNITANRNKCYIPIHEGQVLLSQMDDGELEMAGQLTADVGAADLLPSAERRKQILFFFIQRVKLLQIFNKALLRDHLLRDTSCRMQTTSEMAQFLSSKRNCHIRSSTAGSLSLVRQERPGLTSQVDNVLETSIRNFLGVEWDTTALLLDFERVIFNS